MSERKPVLEIIDTLAQCAQVIIAIFFILVTIKFSSIASRQTEEYNLMTQQQRKSQIQPFLEIASETNCDSTFDNVIVRVRNIGLGPARSLRVMTESYGKIRTLDHVFSPVGNLNIGNIPSRQQIAYTLYPPRGRDFIMPTEEVEFQSAVVNYLPDHLRNRYEKMTPWQRMELVIKELNELVFYFSYIDIDGNEYLSISKMPAMGGITALTITPPPSNSRFSDSLRTLSSTLKNFQSKTYNNVNFRTPEGWFRLLDTLTQK